MSDDKTSGSDPMNNIQAIRERTEAMQQMIDTYDPCAMAVANGMVQLTLAEAAVQLRQLADECPGPLIHTNTLRSRATQLDLLQEDANLLGDKMHEDYHAINESGSN